MNKKQITQIASVSGRLLHDTAMLNKVVDSNFASNITNLVANTSWRPDIVDNEKRVIAAAINFSVSGKASRRICINSYLKKGFVPLFQGCRDKLASFGLVPSEYSDKEAAYYKKLNEAVEKERQEAMRREVEE